MSYLVLARKWRPKGFDDLVGQGPIMRILTNAITQGKIAHAYIFSGPRGVGKTSSARILARALNCLEGPTPTPCGVCGPCMSIADGSSVDVTEIDGASNNSVDDVRDLRERVKYAPSSGRYKVYIIDEVHMLSGSAFNALLKTLEEPPAHVIFVLATTEMKKIPATVISRCQHMPFRRISTTEIRARLKYISEAENIVITPAALGLVARAADGSMRDSLTILDQISSFTSDITEENVKNLLGITDFRLLADIARALFTGDRAAILGSIDSLAEQGADIRTFTRELIQFFRDLLVAAVVKNPGDVLDLGEEELAAVSEILPLAGEDIITLMLAEMMKADSDVRFASAPRLALEMALIRASFLSSMTPVMEAIERLGGRGSENAGHNHQKKSSHVNPVHPYPVHSAPVRKVSPEQEQKPVKAAAQEKAKVPQPEHTPGKPSGELESEIPVADAPDPGAPGSETPGTAASEDIELQLPAESAVPGSAVIASGDLAAAWDQLLSSLDPPLASKLAQTHYELKEDELYLTLNGGHAVFEDSIRERIREIEKTLSAIYGSKLRIKIGTAAKKSLRKKSGLKEKAMEEPLIKEALELFDGRIVDVTADETPKQSPNQSINHSTNNNSTEGGDHV